MYMISTTSYIEYTKEIIKETAKLMEEVHINENNTSEIFAIRTYVKNIENAYIRDHDKQF